MYNKEIITYDSSPITLYKLMLKTNDGNKKSSHRILNHFPLKFSTLSMIYAEWIAIK